MDKNEIAKWLSAGGENGASDVEFAETMVLLWKRQRNDKSDLTATDMKNFSTNDFCAWMKNCLDEIIFSEEIDSSAWWKQQ